MKPAAQEYDSPSHYPRLQWRGLTEAGSGCAALRSARGFIHACNGVASQKPAVHARVHYDPDLIHACNGVASQKLSGDRAQYRPLAIYPRLQWRGLTEASQALQWMQSGLPFIHACNGVASQKQVYRLH